MTDPEWHAMTRADDLTDKIAGIPPVSAGRITRFCEMRHCPAYTWAVGPDHFDAHTAPDGPSSVKPTTNGLWACREHQRDLGGWAP